MTNYKLIIDNLQRKSLKKSQIFPTCLVKCISDYIEDFEFETSNKYNKYLTNDLKIGKKKIIYNSFGGWKTFVMKETFTNRSVKVHLKGESMLMFGVVRKEFNKFNSCINNDKENNIVNFYYGNIRYSNGKIVKHNMLKFLENIKYNIVLEFNVNLKEKTLKIKSNKSVKSIIIKNIDKNMKLAFSTNGNTNSLIEIV